MASGNPDSAPLLLYSPPTHTRSPGPDPTSVDEGRRPSASSASSSNEPLPGGLVSARSTEAQERASGRHNAASPRASGSGSSLATTQEETPAKPKSLAQQRRMQGVSCDACKFRKVKCDRRAKVDKKIAELHATGEPLSSLQDADISCSVCSSHGLKCTFTQAEPKKRRGRRIVEIQAHQRRESYLPSLADAEEEGGGPSIDVTTAAAAAEEARRRHQSSYPGVFPRAVTTASTPLGLFSIPGLTRPLLDTCIMAFFKFTTPTVALLHADVFAARYTKFFELFNPGGPAKVHTSQMDPALAKLPPLTELLILAVGCAGSGLLQAPVTRDNPRAKFKLQQRLSQRCSEILRHVSWTQRLREEGADLVEAVYVLVDPTFPLVDDQYEEDRGPASSLLGVSPDPLRVQPTSHEALVRLTFSLSIHRRPKAEPGAPPDGLRWRTGTGELIDDREMFRKAFLRGSVWMADALTARPIRTGRVRIWWNVYMQDAFRSFGARRTPLIDADAYDQDLPRWAPRRDGDFSTSFGMDPREQPQRNVFSPQAPAPVPGAGSAGDPNPASAGPQPPRFSRFDALWLESVLRLCFITRTVGSRSVSPRAQGRGVLSSDMEHAIVSLSAWQAQLPTELHWETQAGEGWEEGQPPPSLSSIEFRNSLKAAFLEVLAHGQVLGCWAAVKDYGLRTEADVLDAAGMLAARLNIGDNVSPLPCEDTASADPQVRRSASVRVGIAQPNVAATVPMSSLVEQGPAPPEVEGRVRSRLEGLATASFLRMSKVASQAAAVGILRASRTVLRDVTCSYAMWGCGLAADIMKGTEAPRIGPAVLLEEVILATAKLVDAVSRVDSVQDTPAMTRGLENMLSKFAGGLDALRRVRGEPINAASVQGQTSENGNTVPGAGTHSPVHHHPNTSPAAINMTAGITPTPNWFAPHPYVTTHDAYQQAKSMRTDEIATLSRHADAALSGDNVDSAMDSADSNWLEQFVAGWGGPTSHDGPSNEPHHAGPGLGFSMPPPGAAPHLHGDHSATESTAQFWPTGPATDHQGYHHFVSNPTTAQDWAGQVWHGSTASFDPSPAPLGSLEWLWGAGPQPPPQR
ncbi:hypothetical protein IE81DRAFT_363562 [Ceraceosorus guamensis]|uniref:Zn(2)-C6 fungal-type domain-containing protein n=1 Tax=Ceraceosorus guamensis TaxID=1522189 RepID=A0A316W8C4_9BASI|nr:hypothetical protein IE81DRAFT_363562 [Ceraceosorus guamensis]PWN46147.1 hypothetical protein IE81DRAFT_363562 [Ceraceosorus guamensis]